MNSYFEQIPGLIKFLAVIDRDNTPILFTNLSHQEKEIDFQMLVYSSLDLIEYKEQQKSTKNNLDEYVGMLMPFYEYEYDLGTYGFIGNNGIKIISVKKLESTIQETSSELKLKQLCKEVHSKFIKLLLNPFYEKKEFYQESSQLRETFAKNITLPKHSKSLSESQKIFLQPIDQHYDSEGVGQYDYSLIEDDLANLMTKVSRHSESETEELEVNLELDNSDELHFTKIALIADWEGKVKDLRQTNYENALALRDHAYYNPFLMTNKKFCDSYVYILKNYNSRTLNNITTKHTGY